MKKEFCDKCDKELPENDNVSGTISTKAELGSIEGWWYVSANVQFRSDPDDAFGAPDLCKACIVDIINTLLRQQLARDSRTNA